MEKKYRLCSILQKLMDSKDWGNLKTEIGQNLAKRITKEISGNGDEGAESGADSDDDERAESGLLKDLGGMALSMAGAGLIQQFYEWRAERLQKNLSADVLKKFPAHIQTAMEALDDNKDLMPSSMFPRMLPPLLFLRSNNTDSMFKCFIPQRRFTCSNTSNLYFMSLLSHIALVLHIRILLYGTHDT